MMFMRTQSNFGIITLAMGEYHQDLALVLLESLRRYMPNTKVAVIADSRLEYLGQYFDEVIPLNESYGKSLKQKVYLNEYSPFDKTMFIDADVIALRPFQEYVDDFIGRDLSFATSHGFTISMEQKKQDRWMSDPKLFGKKLGVSERMFFPHGGVYCWDREKGQKIFEKAREIYGTFSEECGLVRFGDWSFNEEYAFGCAVVALQEDGNFDRYILKRGLMAVNFDSYITKTFLGKMYVRDRRTEEMKNPGLFHFYTSFTKKPFYQNLKKKALKRLKKINSK